MAVVGVTSGCRDRKQHAAFFAKEADHGEELGDLFQAVDEAAGSMDEKMFGHQTALHQAAVMGNSDAISVLIQGGCALGLQNKNGNTALHEASWHGFFQCVKLLVKAGADVNISNKAGHTALHLASQNAHAQTARLLLVGGAKADSKNNEGDTCLHVAARYNNATLVRMLLSSLCSVDQRNQKGDTALHVAAALNHKKTVKLLLNSGSAGNITNNEGKTALDKARDNNHKHVALLLARDPQVQKHLQGRKDRRVFTAKFRTVPVATKKESSSLVETSSSDPTERKTLKEDHVENYVTSWNIINPERGNEKGLHLKKNPVIEDKLWTNYRNISYTVYRDKDGIVQQAPSGGCPCRPLIKKLEQQVKATREEMRLQMFRMQKVDNKLCEMDLRNKHQILSHKKHRSCVKQAPTRRELKRRPTAQVEVKSLGYKLLSSPPAESDSERQSIPLLSVVSAGSSSSLATYVNIPPPTCSLNAVQQDLTGSDKYLQMKENGSLDDDQNTAFLSLPGRHALGFLVGSDDPGSQSPGVRDGHTPVLLCGQGFVNTSSQSSASEPSSARCQGKIGEESHEPTCARTQATQSRTMEFFIEPPLEPTFCQERNTLHAMEVTQRFFETVSVQLERWYERKVLEVEEQTKLRVQQDKQELLDQINTLEEELRRMKMDEKAGKT
ncbi:ankyrin repeat domain-containing protein 6 isoform X2 [Entelurus aequoreus]|uniref:ankyrin repeat domain-containing protein 6 isoform X2 n=1 Tax=Entelurus aequoreus TaxID=161455 RepID=UPI002B1E8B97|nr:ankyrin repeat domain-containing protein 6 isoform X2 [Entelurus aequoreus]